MLVYVDDIVIAGSTSAAVDRLVAPLLRLLSSRTLVLFSIFWVSGPPTIQGAWYWLHGNVHSIFFIVWVWRIVELPRHLLLRWSALHIRLVHHLVLRILPVSQYYWRITVFDVTCPDLSFAVNKVYQFLSQLTDMHWEVVKRIVLCDIWRGNWTLGCSYVSPHPLMLTAQDVSMIPVLRVPMLFTLDQILCHGVPRSSL
jgi:hypothetical protein